MGNLAHLYLIRHGETDWNRQGRWQGQSDVPLNDQGREQARQIAEKLADISFDAIYSSDLSRASEVARIIAQRQGDEVPIVLDQRLREIHQGEWQGLLVQEIEARYAEGFQHRRTNPLTVAPPGGETAGQVRERALAAIHDILAVHPNGHVAIVSHGFTLAVLLTHFQKLPIDRVWDLVPVNGEIIELEVDPAQVNPG
jgi:broad specificity phosphatase PhoE